MIVKDILILLKQIHSSFLYGGNREIGICLYLFGLETRGMHYMAISVSFRIFSWWPEVHIIGNDIPELRFNVTMNITSLKKLAMKVPQ